MKFGFTLVELAIVLVIIGLLIGGILVAQSLIDTSRISSQVRQIQQFDAAVASFIDKYKGLPGDTTSLGCTGTMCDNTRIDDSLGWQQSVIFEREVANFWVQLQLSGFTQDGASFTATIPAGGFLVTGASRNSPQAAIDSKTGVIAGYTWRWGPVFINNASVYQLADYSTLLTGAYTQSFSTPSLTPAQAFAIDKKMDDGLPFAGTSVRSADNGAITFGSWATTNTNCTTASAYRVGNPGRYCISVIQMMSGSGGLPLRQTNF